MAETVSKREVGTLAAVLAIRIFKSFLYCSIFLIWIACFIFASKKLMDLFFYFFARGRPVKKLLGSEILCSLPAKSSFPLTSSRGFT